MKLLFITDSLGLPRESPELVQYDETWCYLLSKIFESHQCSFGGATIDMLTSQLNYLKLYNPDVVIVQSGIVDCAPRAMSKTENYLINKFWFSRKIFSRFSHSLIKLLRRRGKTYTSQEVFRQKIYEIQKVFGDKVYWLSIIEANAEYEDKIPGISQNIETYNSIINSCFGERFIDISDLKKDCLTSDMHHLNAKGHHIVFKKIINILN